MKKRLLFVAALLLALLTLLTFAGCSGQEKTYDDRVKVVFELEGGVYQNSSRAVTHYYPFAPDTQNLISDLETLSGSRPERAGYTLEGWYTTRTVGADGSVSYGGKWDFSTHKVGDDGVTLYACWKRNVSYTFEICYYDADGALQVLGTYPVDAGEAFDDYRNFATKRPGYTSLGTYHDAEGNPVDETYCHPGGETSLAIQVFADYIEGEYAIVRTANDLVRAKNSNIYLMNDIDFEGRGFGGFGAYHGVIEGNGHTVRNFNLTYDNGKNAMINDPDLGDGNLLCVSLFSSLTGATLRNVSFADFTVTVGTGYSSTRQILFAPLCMKLSGSTLENVSVSLSYAVGELPRDFDAEQNLILVTEKPYFFASPEDTSSVDVDLTVTEISTEQD